MQKDEAFRVIECLRKGLPPTGHIERFTVGREEEINHLDNALHGGLGPVLLLKANYGSGKSHLLHFIKEKALRENYAVSMVVLDARSGVRFNRMDQILGAIMRNIEIPGAQEENGIASALDFITSAYAMVKLDPQRNAYWSSVSNNFQWDYSETLKCDGMFVALRAWINGDKETKDLVVDWLQNPHNFKNERSSLHWGLVGRLRNFFRDPRADWKFYADNVFAMHNDGYKAAWAALEDMDVLLKNSGLRGLIILFDEFEDILTGINNIKLQEDAFWNLFLFFSGTRFTGRSFYAVTPNFIENCKMRLLVKGRFDFDYSHFDRLRTFEMSPLIESDLFELAKRILVTHTCAFEYNSNDSHVDEIKKVVQISVKSPVQDRARHTIRRVVENLDEKL